MKVAEGVEMLDLTSNLALGPGVIHPTLLWDNTTVILVDAAMPAQLSQIREAMLAAGTSFDKLSKIIITHSDMDHIGGLAGILKESSLKVTVLAHEKEKPFIEAEKPPLRLTQIEAQLPNLSGERGQQMKALYENLKANYHHFKAQVDQTLEDGELLPGCGGITVIATPGHTPGHVCLYLRTSKTLIAGDAFNVDNGKLVPAPPFVTLDKDEAIHSLKKLTEFDVATVICYHGGLYQDNCNRRIAKIANH